MSYTPYTWQTGDTITAARLNNMEDGIAASGYDAVFKISGENAEVVQGDFATVWAKYVGEGGFTGVPSFRAISYNEVAAWDYCTAYIESFTGDPGDPADLDTIQIYVMIMDTSEGCVYAGMIAWTAESARFEPANG